MQLSLVRPGRMRFEYTDPPRFEIVADGRSVAIIDRKLNTQDEYFIGQTPLKFLLSDHIDLARDTEVLSVAQEGNAVTIEVEDRAALGGTAHLTLVFDASTFALKQWTVIDAQGFQTVVTLFNVDLKTQPDPALFHIDENCRPISLATAGADRGGPVDECANPLALVAAAGNVAPGHDSEPQMTFSIATWNINSVRLRIDLVVRYLAEHQPDVLCLQETKCPDANFPHGAFRDAGYPHIAINGQKGYHGVAIVSRIPLATFRQARLLRQRRRASSPCRPGRRGAGA